jgi:hypothetical protein
MTLIHKASCGHLRLGFAEDFMVHSLLSRMMLSICKIGENKHLTFRGRTSLGSGLFFGLGLFNRYANNKMDTVVFEVCV